MRSAPPTCSDSSNTPREGLYCTAAPFTIHSHLTTPLTSHILGERDWYSKGPSRVASRGWAAESHLSPLHHVRTAFQCQAPLQVTRGTLKRGIGKGVGCQRFRTPKGKGFPHRGSREGPGMSGKNVKGWLTAPERFFVFCANVRGFSSEEKAMRL